MSYTAFEDQFLCLHCNKPLKTDKVHQMHGDLYCPRCQSWESKDIPYRKWLSKGCEKEYKKAKAKYIQILCIEDFLEGKEVEL